MFTEVQSLDADTCVALGKIDKRTGKPFPKQAEGYYLGFRKVENRLGDSKLYFLQTSKGNLGVWGGTDLDKKLGQVIPGVMIRITSTGKKPTPAGDMYTYKVEVDNANTIEVSAPTEYTNLAEKYDDTRDDTPDDPEDSDEHYEDAEQAAALVQAERKAKVDAIFAAKGKKQATK